MHRFSLLFFLLSITPFVFAQEPFDILVRNAYVYMDTTISSPELHDIGIRDGRIVSIEEELDATAETVIDAEGLVVMPGFIDPHTHLTGLLSNPETSMVEHYLRQGVTTVIVGNDGGGSVDVAGLLTRWNDQGIGLNAGVLVGHGTVRRSVMKMSDRPPTDDQLNEMKALVRQAMEQGAFGLSSGLFYTPGSYAHTREVIELARVAAEYDGVYDTHMRDESSYSIGLIASVSESIHIAREADIRLNISHIKALGVDVWGKSTEVAEMIIKAQHEGIRVTADQYPYVASNTGLTAALVPRWALVDGGQAFRTRLDDPETRTRILDDMRDNLRRRGGPESLLLVNSRHDDIHTKRLNEIADAWDVSPIDAALRAILDKGGASVISFNMTEDDVRTFMQQDFVMIGSDGGALRHPRSYGSFPRALMRYLVPMEYETYTRKVEPRLSPRSSFLYEHKTSRTAAKAFAIKDRGSILPGYFADIVIFDPERFIDHATYEEPQRMSEGVIHLIINGQLAIHNEELTGVKAGQPLSRN